MSCIPYHNMAILDLWPIRFRKSRYSHGERNSIEVLLFHLESITQVGVGIIEGDLNFYEFFDLDKKATKKIVEKAFEDYWIAHFIVKYAEKLFALIDDAINAGIFDASPAVGGQGKVKPVELLKWLPRKQYYAPAGLVESLEIGDVERAELLLKVFRQGFLYQFICECSGKTKRESCEQLHENMKGFSASDGVVAQIERESAEVPTEPEQPGGVNGSKVGAKPKKDWEKVLDEAVKIWEESDREMRLQEIYLHPNIQKTLSQGKPVTQKYAETKISKRLKGIREKEEEASVTKTKKLKGRNLKVTKR